MKQGKFGISLVFYGILAFILAIAQQPLLCGMLLGFVILAEGDRWAVRQVLQGFFLSLVTSFLLDISYTVGSFVSLPFRFLFGWYNNYDFINTVQNLFSFLVYAGALVLGIMAILRLCRGHEANVPVLSSLSYRVYGEEKPRPVKQQPAYPPQGYPQPPLPYPPQQGMPPMQQGQAGMPQPPMQVYPVPPQPPQGVPVAPQAVQQDLQDTAQLPHPLVQPQPVQQPQTPPPPAQP